jgi:hypothetical protein
MISTSFKRHFVKPSQDIMEPELTEVEKLQKEIKSLQGQISREREREQKCIHDASTEKMFWRRVNREIDDHLSIIRHNIISIVDVHLTVADLEDQLQNPIETFYHRNIDFKKALQNEFSLNLLSEMFSKKYPDDGAFYRGTEEFMHTRPRTTDDEKEDIEADMSMQEIYEQMQQDEIFKGCMTPEAYLHRLPDATPFMYLIYTAKFISKKTNDTQLDDIILKKGQRCTQCQRLFKHKQLLLKHSCQVPKKVDEEVDK